MLLCRDLSRTSIKTLPFIGLHNLEVLQIRETPLLHTIPSLYDLRVRSSLHLTLNFSKFSYFKSLKKAKLTHHFHCCAFKYPKQHAPTKHADFQKDLRTTCEQNQIALETPKKRKRQVD